MSKKTVAMNKRGFLKRLGTVTTALAIWPRRALARSEWGYPRLMHGPMVGAVSDNSAWLWMRASGRFPVSVRYADNPQMANAKITAPVQATLGNDYITKLLLTDLQPGKAYWYQALVNGEAPRYMEGLPPFRFRTAPVPGAPTRFRVAFGSCARIQEFPRQPIWSALQKWEPDLFFWLGDNVYADTREPSLIAETYQQQRAVAEFQAFGRSVPQLATWDDHDYGLNNHDHSNPIKDFSLATFKRYWANPAAGLDDVPGVFFKYNYGGVDFFFLDNRYHRSPNNMADGPEKTQLGAAQKEWLKAGLKASRAAFKVLIAGGEWCGGKDEFGDSWAGFLRERNELFDYIRDRNIGGVVLMSGNIHRHELNAIPWSERGGYDFYDFCSSPLAQDSGMPGPDEEPERRMRAPYTGGPNAGVVDFDLTGESPTLTFRAIDTNGRAVAREFRLTADELRNGRSTWSEKMDERLRAYYASRNLL